MTEYSYFEWYSIFLIPKHFLSKDEYGHARKLFKRYKKMMNIGQSIEGKNKGIIGVGGLMLARIPTETVQERTEYFRDQTRNQLKAVDENLMREQHPSMPISVDRQSRVTFGGKEKPSE